MTQIFVDWNRFDKGEIMRYVLNGPLREYINKRRTDETKTKLTETFLITPGIHTNKTKHQNKEGVIKRVFFLSNCLKTDL